MGNRLLNFLPMSLLKKQVCRNRPNPPLPPFIKGGIRKDLLKGLWTVVFLVIFLTPAFSEELLVAAASDLIFAFSEIGKNFEAETGNKVIFSFGSTGMLTEQIRHGAPFDVFAAADDKSIMELSSKNLIKENSTKFYAKGQLVVVFNKNIKSIRDIRGLESKETKRISIANPDHAPYGLAAKQALIREGLWNKLQPKIILGENVRQALQFVQTGNAEAGIVALSIAKVPEVNYFLVDENLYPLIKQTIVILKRSGKKKLAKEFVDFALSKKGKIILERFGYKVM